MLRPPGVLVAQGSVHPAVREAQRALNRVHEREVKARGRGLDSAPLVEDCIFGRLTRDATLSFQRLVFPNQPDEQDGIIGDKTWTELDRASSALDGPIPTPQPEPSPQPQAVKTIKVWWNTFIPHRQVDGPPGSECFAGDNRGFSNDIHAPHRTHQEIEVEVATLIRTIDFSDIGETHEIDCKTGSLIARDKAPASEVSNGPVKRLGGEIAIGFSTSASNPLVAIAPAIDSAVLFRVDPVARTCSLSGEHDGFPAYEAYVTADGGAGAAVYQYDPRAAGRDISALFPPMDERVTAGPKPF